MITRSSAHTDPGRRRDHNEDACWTPGPGWPSEEDVRRKGRLYVVADGMGGHQAGEVAAGIAVDVIPNRYYADPDPDRAAALLHAIEAANAQVFRAAQERPDQEKMGTTVVAAVVHGDRLIVGHAGDSRAYRLRDGRLEQLTRDHSWVEQRRQAGVLTAEEAASHPLRNVVTRSLGHGREIEPTMGIGPVRPGDRLLLCSDGLWEPVGEREIARILATEPPDRAVRALIDAANAAGGPDNVTAAAVYVEERRRRGALGLLAVAGGGAGLVLLGLLCVSMGRLLPHLRPTPTPIPTATSTPLPTSTPSPTPTPTPTPPDTSLDPVLLGRSIPYQGLEDASVIELGERFGFGPLIEVFGSERVVMRGVIQGRPLTVTRSITLPPRPPMGVIVVGELAVTGSQIGPELSLGMRGITYTVALSQSETIVDRVLVDQDRLLGRVVGLIDGDRIYALTLELRARGDSEWRPPIYDEVPDAGWMGWFYFRDQPLVTRGHGALADIDCGMETVAAYLSLAPDGGLDGDAFCLSPR